MTIVPVVDLRSKLLPIRNQGNRPTCLAHSATVAHEHDKTLSQFLSVEYLHRKAHHSRSDSARTYTEIQHSLNQEGQPYESACPYGIYPFSEPLTSKMHFANAGVINHDFSTIKDKLRNGKIAVLGLSTNDQFYRIAGTPHIITADDKIEAIMRCCHRIWRFGSG